MNKAISTPVCVLALTAFILGSAPAGKTEGVFEQPILLTSAGQSADVQLASVLIKKAGLTCTLSKLAADKDLQAHKTLVLVLGASLKGLGAAGLDMAKEKARVEGLLKAAKAGNVPLLCLHLGGADRRGQTTDEMTAAYLPQAKMAIIVKSGNQDGFFTKLCRDHDIPLVEVEKTIEAAEPIKNAFK